ncbi:MAG TPA: YceI family protein [Chitinophagales bacterium]|nr:YceI family protein [Chitinophagales bacterium]HRK27865.1 YceI family protein [Chitinophagales bacterium]
MKSINFFTLVGAIAAFVLMSFGLPAGERSSVSIDTQKSKIGWTGYKVTGKHTGFVTLKRGTLSFEGDKLVGGNFEIDMNTITCTDLEGEWADKLVGHLKSDDFFGAAKFPVVRFNITNVIARGPVGEYKITGDLTIKETTKPIKFNANVTTNADKTMVSVAKVTIDRSDYDVRYGSGSFFDGLGDKAIYDEFDLDINLVSNSR